MKSLFKFTLLLALIVGGKMAKQPTPAAMAQATSGQIVPDTSVVLVHQVLTSEPVKPAQTPVQAQHSGNGLLAEMF